ncbi:universal stress protein [Pseudomonas aeruginosa]|nr:universal stress protein [Pseudomonas aeruginosa]
MRAAALAKARNAELTVLNVLDDDQPPVLIAPQRLAIANLLEVNGQALKERLGVESKAIVRVGDPVVVINAAAATADRAVWRPSPGCACRRSRRSRPPAHDARCG